jgi:hypothetical protein
MSDLFWRKRRMPKWVKAKMDEPRAQITRELPCWVSKVSRLRKFDSVVRLSKKDKVIAGPFFIPVNI